MEAQAEPLATSDVGNLQHNTTETVLLDPFVLTQDFLPSTTAALDLEKEGLFETVVVVEDFDPLAGARNATAESALSS